MERTAFRELRDFIERQEEYKSVLLLEGARQVGKTFLINSYLEQEKNKKVIATNLEKDLLLRNKIDTSDSFEDFTSLLKRDFGFKDQEEQIIFIDEAQESKKLGSFVRFMKEEWKSKTTILTGSSMTRLFDGARVPVGRVEYLRLFPFSFIEFINGVGKGDLLESLYDGGWDLKDSLHQELLEFYDIFLSLGGLPAVINSYIVGEDIARQNDIRKEIFLSQQEDFYRKEFSLKHHLFEDAMKAVANTVGHPFSLTRITNNHRDAKSVLEIMEQWHLILKCEQRSRISASRNFHPKLYLYDVGLLRQLRDTVLPSVKVLSKTSSVLRSELGGVVENALYLSLLSGKGFLQNITGWKKGPKYQVEVDFIYQIGERRIPIEVKASLRLHKRHYSSIIEYLKQCEMTLGILVSGAPYSEYLIDELRIINIPFYFADRFMIKLLVDKYLND